LTTAEGVARFLGCYLEDVPALLEEPAPDSTDMAAVKELAERYEASAGRLLTLLAAALGTAERLRRLAAAGVRLE